MITAGQTWGHIQREWGYEVRVDFTDSETGRVHNERMVFDKAPKDSKEVDAVVESKRIALEARLAAEAATQQEEDSKVLTDIEKTAWTQVETKVLEYIKAQVSDSAVSKEDAAIAAEYLIVIEAALKSVAEAEKDATAEGIEKD